MRLNRWIGLAGALLALAATGCGDEDGGGAEGAATAETAETLSIYSSLPLQGASAAQEDGSIAYIGEFNSGASAISMPRLNEVPLAQVSPGNTAVG